MQDWGNDEAVLAYTLTLTGPPPQIVTPRFSPAPRVYRGSVSVSISTATTGATIRYTTNGVTPDTRSAAYVGPITLTKPTTLMARAFKAGWQPSNVASGFYTVGLPDLQGALLTGPVTASWGQSVSVRWQLRNAGPLSAGASRVQWYLSRDGLGSADDVLLSRPAGAGTSYLQSGVAADASSSLYTTPVQLPSAAPLGWTGSSFFVIMKADATNQVVESNESNNFGQMGTSKDRAPITIGLPDLQGATLTAPTTTAWGQAVSVRWQVRNAGPVPAGEFRVQWYLSRDSVGSADDRILGLAGGVHVSYLLAGLATGASGPLYTTQLQLPGSPPSGWTGSSFYLIMKVDTTSRVAESNESNNFGQVGTGKDRAPVTIGRPDLQGAVLTGPAAAKWGQAVSVRWQVRNAGPVSAGDFRVQWYLSRDSAGSVDDRILGLAGGVDVSYPHAGLAAGASGPLYTTQLQLPGSPPSGWTGSSFYLIMKVDTTGRVVESNENNNFGQVGAGKDRAAITITTATQIVRSLVISGQANVFAAGHSTIPTPDGTGILPPVCQFAAGTGKTLTFASVTGLVACEPGADYGPDGLEPWSGTDLDSVRGVSGIVDEGKGMFLVGVFLDSTEPADPAPPRLNFTGNEGFVSLNPQLRQTFFIGDGLTGNGWGSRQVFHVPATATRLFLGFADGGYFTGTPGTYSDNSGQLVAQFTIR